MKNVVVLLGPTGVGKTGVSLLMAKELSTEIISADSMQIYRGMDIGTAKPSQEELQMVKHHMIDIVEPSETFSAGQYIAAVSPIIADMHARGRVPLVVGGTGLYIKAMTRGLFSGPSADMPLRESLAEMEQQEEGSLFAYLSELDPGAAVKIEKNDSRRIIRALEVCLKGGAVMSELQQKATKPLPHRFIKIGLIRDRRELYRIIDSRVDRMIGQGLFQEVETLLAGNPSMTPLQAIGYKEVADYLKGNVAFEETVRLIKRNSRRYAKRQMTWFRKEEGVHWIDITGLSESKDIFHCIKKYLQEKHQSCHEPH